MVPGVPWKKKVGGGGQGREERVGFRSLSVLQPEQTLSLLAQVFVLVRSPTARGKKGEKKVENHPSSS